MSSQRSGGVRSITFVKLTFSLAAVSPATPASTASRAVPRQRRGRGHAEHRAERVRAAVAEHRPLAEVLRQQRDGRARRAAAAATAGPWPGARRPPRGRAGDAATP